MVAGKYAIVAAGTPYSSTTAGTPSKAGKPEAATRRDTCDSRGSMDGQGYLATASSTTNNDRSKAGMPCRSSRIRSRSWDANDKRDASKSMNARNSKDASDSSRQQQQVVISCKDACSCIFCLARK